MRIWKKSVISFAVTLLFCVHAKEWTEAAGTSPRMFACSSLDGPFCPLINGLNAPSIDKQVKEDSFSLSVIDGDTLDQAVGQVKQAIKDIYHKKSTSGFNELEQEEQAKNSDGNAQQDLEPVNGLLDLRDWGSVSQSTVDNGHGPSFAVDTVRNAERTFEFTKTRYEKMPYWQVDLYKPLPITMVEVWNPNPEHLWLLLSEGTEFPNTVCKKEGSPCLSFERAAAIASRDGIAVLPSFCSDTFLDQDDIERVFSEELAREMTILNDFNIDIDVPEDVMLKRLGFTRSTVCVYELEEPVLAQHLRLQWDGVGSMEFSEVEIFIRQYQEDETLTGQEEEIVEEIDEDFVEEVNAFVFHLPADADLGTALKRFQEAVQETMTELQAEFDSSEDEAGNQEEMSQASGDDEQKEISIDIDVDVDLGSFFSQADEEEYSEEKIQEMIEKALEMLDLEDGHVEHITVKQSETPKKKKGQGERVQ